MTPDKKTEERFARQGLLLRKDSDDGCATFKNGPVVQRPIDTKTEDKKPVENV
jgi:hypothetical protein